MPDTRENYCLLSPEKVVLFTTGFTTGFFGSCGNNEKPGETLFSQLEHNWITTVELCYLSFSLFSQLPKCDHIYASGHRASQRFLLYPNLNLPNLEKYQFYELHKTKYRKGST